ncbi:MAG: hypothetical protein KAU48_02675, partial [Candidatus Thorarchaeota archaeon]|nr:hypothetical protein [Candidatus Thorarchaeota archaeon]
MFKYAFKRVIRSYRLFIALTIGVLLATSFFAATNVAADILSRSALDASVEDILYDFNVDSEGLNWTIAEMEDLENDLRDIDGIVDSTHSSIIEFEFNSTGVNMTLAGLESSSPLMSGVQVISGSLTLGANETYVVRGSTNESLFELGQEIEVAVGVSRGYLPPSIIYRNFTVVGYVDMPDRNRDALAGAAGGMFAMLMGLGGGARGFTMSVSYNYLIADWDLSFQSIIEEA